MRKSILAIAAVGTVFALTAAGASSLTVNAGAVPAGGSANATVCTASVAVAYTADAAVPANVHSVDVTPTITEAACQTLPALVKITWNDGSAQTGYSYLGSGLGTSVSHLTGLYSTAALAIAAGTADVTLPSVASFGSPAVGVTIAGAFN